jgi:outer membrane protein insertion porin family
MSLRLQGSSYFQTYSLSFSEPWLGGKKPMNFSASISHSKQFLYNFRTRDVTRNQSFNITSLSVGLAKRLRVPDDYFVLSQGLTFQYYDLNNYNTGGGRMLVRPGDYLEAVPSQSNPRPKRVDNYQDAAADPAKVDQKRFNWLEYYKIKLKGDWYTRIYDKLVLRTLGEFGFMGAYNQDRGLVPFERFYLGGDGLANFSLDGREVIQLRGYPNNSLSSLDGGTIYNKFSLELRYPITLKQAATIYGLTFLEGGASFDDFSKYNPFRIQRSAGFGLRVFMPAFGLLGIDFAHGFDAIPGSTQKSGWQTHFIIGQQF